MNRAYEDMYVSQMDGFLNRWYTHYEDAIASLELDGGYLFPHRGQFFITPSEGIRELGIDPLDPDWAAIGWNWVKPKDLQAKARLKKKINTSAELDIAS